MKILTLTKEILFSTMQNLHKNEGFDFLIDLCGVDWPEREKRFDVVYHLLNSKNKTRLRVKVPIHEFESIPSVSSIWKNSQLA